MVLGLKFPEKGVILCSSDTQEVTMRHYFAPLEGLTDSIYRRLHQKYFPGIDRYYMPFISPTMHHSFTTKEKRDLPEAGSVPFVAIPQILTKSPEDFLWAAGCCKDLGYEQVNLNMGCPSGTVVSKGKGAGMLQNLDTLRAFLDAVFSATPVAISVKTRIGMSSPEEFPAILALLEQYPNMELTIHPRVRQAFYKGNVDLDAFAYAMTHSAIPLCYNGDLCSQEDIDAIAARFPQLQAVMIGRGLIGCPGMLCPGGIDRAKLTQFHDELMEEYCITFGNRRNAMCRMKENWRHLLCLFEGGEALGKKLRKTTDYDGYLSVTREILTGLPLRDKLQPDW